MVSSLRDSTTGYCLSPLTGLQFRLTFGSQTPLQLPIYRAAQIAVSTINSNRPNLEFSGRYRVVTERYRARVEGEERRISNHPARII